jgi:oxygen-independent coproporphyrinogen-3 oxidase
MILQGRDLPVKIKVTGNREWIKETVRDIAGIFAVRLVEDGQEGMCNLQIDQDVNLVTATAVFSFIAGGNAFSKETCVAREADINNQEKRLIKKLFYQTMQKAGNFPGSPWGILTGVRPAKLAHRLLDQNMPPPEAAAYLREHYLIDGDKSKLLVQTALNQRHFLLSQGEAKRKIGIYIGIPFCATRCDYCSFPAYPLAKMQGIKEQFLVALHQEITAVSEFLAKKGIIVQHIYLGGGTPTSITVSEIDNLLNLINSSLRSKETVEVTVEAGRPDTLSKEMLTVLAEQQVTRISVNPQTLQNKTLQLIGREHTAEDFWDAYLLAKSMGIPIINVDLIIGLPGEKAEDVAKTITELRKVELDNLTIHSLAFKRASRLLEMGVHQSSEEADEIAVMAKLAKDYAADQGMIPYYLYRQKRISGLGENIGYCRPGLECIYNIQVMEERQTIIGLGGGAGSKWVNPEDWTLIASYNPKDPATYIANIGTIIDRKRNQLFN